MLRLASMEFGPWRAEAIAVDELYFSACAMRGVDVGEVPSTGCQDNKAPIIFLVHQFVLAAAGTYSIVGVKVAAFGVVAVLITMVAGWAWRLTGPLGAMVAASLALQVLASDARLIALKTESVGGVFMLAGALLLTGADRVGGARWFASGVLLGLAVMTKQTFGFAAVAIMVWRWTKRDAWAGSGARQTLRVSALFALGGSLPALIFLAAFHARDQHVDFLTSVFLYPLLYTSAEFSAGNLSELAWRATDIMADLSNTPLLIGLSAMAIAYAMRRGDSDEREPASSPVFAMILSLLALSVVSPIYFKYHLVPALLLLAVAGGSAFHVGARAVARCPVAAARAMSAGIVALAFLTTSQIWKSNSGRTRMVELLNERAAFGEFSGSYAYSLGDPGFYVYNGLIPASDAGFLWALPGTEATWCYTPPTPGTWKWRLVRPWQENNARRLIRDFEKTPPRFIVLESAPVGSAKLTGVELLDRYMARNCAFDRVIKTRRSEDNFVFACRVPN